MNNLFVLLGPGLWLQACDASLFPHPELTVGPPGGPPESTNGFIFQLQDSPTNIDSGISLSKPVLVGL